MIFSVNFSWSQESTYVGSDKCKKCHERVYQQWKESPHRKIMLLPGPQTVGGDFSKNNTLIIKGKNTKMTTSQGKYFVSTTGPQGREDIYLVAYVLGGSWKQRYLTQFANGEFYVLPVQWNVAERRWEDFQGLLKSAPGQKDFWSAPERSWNRECAGCHVTALTVKYDPNQKIVSVNWVETAVGCEMCHGPGSAHVVKGDKSKITSIASLTFRQKTELCGQCHVSGYSRHQEIKYAYPVGYRPGELLSDYYSPIDLDPGENTERFWGSGQERSHHQQYIGFLSSKHYGKRAATCITCHSPHSSNFPHMLIKDNLNNSLCYTCHVDKWANLTAHTHHQPLAQSPGSRCTNCHMIYTAQTINQYDMATHTFWVPSPEDTLRFKIPNACNNCHQDKSPTWALEVMIKWWGGKAPQ